MFADNKSAVFERLQKRLFNLTESDLKGMSGLQKVTAGAIVFDKQRLQDDKSTANVFDLHSFHENGGRMEEIEGKLRKLGVNLSEADQT